MAAYPSRHQWMARGDAPLQLPVQPGVGAPALEPAQDAAADEDAQGHAQDDERRRDGDRAEHPGQRRADQQAGGANYGYDIIMLVALLVVASMFIGVCYHAYGTYAEIHTGRKTWGQFGLTVAIGAVLLVIGIWLLTEATGIL